MNEILTLVVAEMSGGTILTKRLLHHWVSEKATTSVHVDLSTLVTTESTITESEAKFEAPTEETSWSGA